MPHITFIHGIDNKPPRDELLAIWKESLAEDGGIDLDALGVTTSMVYWADVMYESPVVAAIEESMVEAEAEPDSQVIEQLAKAAANPTEARFLAGLAGKLSIAAMQSMVAVPVEEAVAGGGIEERVPLPWIVKEPLMAVLLRDVHHYLFNESFSPREGKTYQVQDEIRSRFVNELSKHRDAPGPHLVISHSMGTVIAYDCLLRVADCPLVDGLMTIGSPLGLDEIQDQMQPDWTRRNGFPGKLRETWINVFDRLDPVAGFDPKLANDYQRDGRRVVVDVSQSNSGLWRHNISKYLSGRKLRDALRSLLGISVNEFRDVRETPADAGAADGRAGRSGKTSWVSIAAVERVLSPDKSEAASLEEAAAHIDAKVSKQTRFLAELDRALRQLRHEADEQGASVMSTPQHRLASILQSVVHEVQESVPTNEIEEFAFDHDDTKDVLRKVFEKAKNVEKHPPAHAASDVPEPIPNHSRIFLVSDVGTGLYGAPVIASTISRGARFDLLLHLGDIYYSGEPEEVQQRFLNVWPKGAGDMSRTLNGNHDMYSGGYGYFDVALPAFKQESSYFAMQNKHWLLVALDTAYKDNNLGKTQLKWLWKVLDQAGERRLVLFSHHPLFSNFKDQGTALAKKLLPLLKSKRVTAWYWGHEHHSVIYDKHSRFDFLGRCLGNGGMPYKRKDLNGFPVEKRVRNCAWRRATSLVTPPALYLDGPNPYITAGPADYGVQGYMTLELDGKHLREMVFTADGDEMYQNVI